MAKVQQVTAHDFSREVFFSPTPVVVDIYADWCTPCRTLAPLLEQWAKQFEGKVKFLKVNVDEEADIAEIYRVETIPTLLLFKDGQLVKKITGIPSKQDLHEMVSELVGQSDGHFFHRLSRYCEQTR